METEECVLKETLMNCLREQLNEIEVLKSMYPMEKEIVTNNEHLELIQKFIDNKLDFVPHYLDVTVNIIRNKYNVQLSINLPTMYPQEPPHVFVRCDQLNRQEETSLNISLEKYVVDHVNKESCIMLLILWLQDYIDGLHSESCKTKTIENTNVIPKYVRMWILSHHIYNKKKRELIVKRAKEYNLKGFCLPGKPGVVCIEGTDENCHLWWKEIKSMTWKKIGLKKLEELTNEEDCHFDKFFEMLEDMTEFAKFMNSKGFSHIYNEIFGLSSVNT